MTYKQKLDEMRKQRDELLEVMKEALSFLDRPEALPSSWYKIDPKHVAKFRSAIAKVEGSNA